MTAFDILKTYYEDRTRGGREWQKQGGRVVGYTCHYIPEEILYAGGLMPVRIVGDPYEEPTIVDKYFEDICSPWVYSVYDLLLKHKFDFLDGWVMAESNDSIIRLHYTLLGFIETRPKNYFWMDVLRRATLSNYNFVLREVEGFKKSLEKTYGITIADEALAQAIKIYNENRQLLRKVSELRRRNPAVISGEEAYTVIGAGFWMRKEEHNKLLKQYLTEKEQSPGHYDSIRLYLSGSPQHNLDFVRLVESLGAVIVADDIDTGDRYFECDVSEEPLMSPVENLTERMLWRFPDPRVYPIVIWHDYVERRIKEAAADSVIFYFLKWEDIYGFHYPCLKERTDKLGIPSQLLEMQEYRLSAPDRLKVRIEALIEMLKENKKKGIASA